MTKPMPAKLRYSHICACLASEIAEATSKDSCGWCGNEKTPTKTLIHETSMLCVTAARMETKAG